MKDGFGREISYVRISLTDRCNLRCRYCMPEEGVSAKCHSDIMSFENLEKVADSFIELGVEKIRVTGGEPLVRKGAINFIEALGKKNLKKLSITTNGSLLKVYARDLKNAGVDTVNISLDTLDGEKYSRLTRIGDINAVFEGIEEARRAGLNIKLNAVLIKGINDGEIGDILAFAKRYGAEMRFIELMPFQTQRDYAAENFIGAAEIIARYPEWTYLGSRENSVAEYYDTGEQIVGFIEPLSHKFCSVCNRVRITADGLLLPCLHRNVSFDLRPHLDGDLTGFIAECIKQKPCSHELEAGKLQNRGMSGIGG